MRFLCHCHCRCYFSTCHPPEKFDVSRLGRWTYIVAEHVVCRYIHRHVCSYLSSTMYYKHPAMDVKQRAKRAMANVDPPKESMGSMGSLWILCGFCGLCVGFWGFFRCQNRERAPREENTNYLLRTWIQTWMDTVISTSKEIPLLGNIPRYMVHLL